MSIYIYIYIHMYICLLEVRKLEAAAVAELCLEGEVGHQKGNYEYICMNAAVYMYTYTYICL